MSFFHCFSRTRSFNGLKRKNNLFPKTTSKLSFFLYTHFSIISSFVHQIVIFLSGFLRQRNRQKCCLLFQTNIQVISILLCILDGMHRIQHDYTILNKLKFLTHFVEFGLLWLLWNKLWTDNCHHQSHWEEMEMFISGAFVQQAISINMFETLATAYYVRKSLGEI